jgi:N utilization substance protein A
MTARGPEIRVSRSHPDMVRKIFSVEIPEIANGVVEVKGVAREAGARSKVAVWTADEDIDPIGSCIGQRGTRIQTIIAELGGEKIDIVAFNENSAKYVASALSPAKVLDVELNEESKSALVKVASDQYSLAIGRGGQNVRLASQLTGWQVVVEEQKVEKIASEVEEKKEESVEEEESKKEE